MGDRSTLHAVKVKHKLKLSRPEQSIIEEYGEQNNMPLSKILTDDLFSNDISQDRSNTDGKYMEGDKKCIILP